MSRQPGATEMAIYHVARQCMNFDQLIALGYEHGLRPICAGWMTVDGERRLSWVEFTHIWDTTNAVAVTLDYDR